MPRKKATVKKFEQWKKNQQPRKTTNMKKFVDTVSHKQLAQELITEEKLERLFEIVERVGQMETKVSVAITDFENLIGKRLRRKIYSKAEELQKLILEFQKDLLDEIQMK